MADTYEVTGQRQTTRLSPSGQFQEVVEVAFTTKPSGASGTVVVPVSQYQPDAVIDMLTRQAAALETVHQS